MNKLIAVAILALCSLAASQAWAYTLRIHRYGGESVLLAVVDPGLDLFDFESSEDLVNWKPFFQPFGHVYGQASAYASVSEPQRFFRVRLLQDPPKIAALWMKALRSYAVQGGSPEIWVTLFGGGPYHSAYWFRDGEQLAWANSPASSSQHSITLRNVQVEDAGMYTVLVSNKFGTTLSAPIELLVMSGAEQHDGPKLAVLTPRAVLDGQPLSLISAGFGTGLGFQWSRISGGQTNVIEGATNAIYTLGQMSASLAGSYLVVLTNIAGRASYFDGIANVGVKSARMELALAPPFAITQSIAGRSVLMGVQSGIRPFASSGTGAISFSADGLSYILLLFGYTVSSGTCSFGPGVGNTAALQSNDSLVGQINTQLEFISPTAGTFFNTPASGLGWQLGAFQIQ